jgi:hypothetical protein
MTARHYREGVDHCARCGTRHTHVSCHEDGTLIGADDRPDLVLDILTAYAAIEGHASSATMKDVISPRPLAPPGHRSWIVDRRTKAGKAWQERVLLVSCIELELHERGLMRVVEEPCEPDGEFSWGFAITETGRAHLAAAQAQKHPKTS